MELYKVSAKVSSSWARIRTEDREKAAAIFFKNVGDNINSVTVSKEDGFGEFAYTKDMRVIKELLSEDDIEGEIKDNFI